MMIDQITSGPIGPSRARPDDFAEEAAEYVSWKINTNVPEMQTIITQMNASTAQVALNTLSAEAYKNQAVSATDAYGWGSGGSSKAFAVEETLVFTDGHSYRCVTATSAGQSPTTHPAKWQQITATPRTIKTEARTTNTPITVFDRGTFFEFTGTFTQTFDNVADIEEGWFCFLKNAGTGEITLDPYGSELIDGLSSYVMYPGECRLCRSTGTAFKTTVLEPFSTTFTVSGTFYKPPGYTVITALVWSGGNSGSKINTSDETAYGGGGGGCFKFHIETGMMSTSEIITIGSGGASQTSANTNGNVGTESSIGVLCVVYSGSFYSWGGSVLQNGNPDGVHGRTGGVLGAITNQYPNSIYGGSATYTNTYAPNEPTYGGSSVYGGAAGGSVFKTGVATSAGVSTYGGDGGVASSASDGADGVAPGGGGGATRTGSKSGAGARGEVRIFGGV